MPVVLVEPDVNILKEVAKRIKDLEPDKVLILFPHRRAMAFLKYYLAEVKKPPFFAPRMRSFEDWVRGTYILAKDASETPIEKWDQAYLVWQAAKEVLDSGSYPLVASWEKFFGWGLKLAELFKDLELELKTPDNVEYANVPKEVRPLVENIGKIYRRFGELLEACGLTTTARMTRYLAERGFESPSCEVHAVGFYALTEAESAIFKRLYDNGAFFWWHAYEEELPPLYRRWRDKWRITQWETIKGSRKGLSHVRLIECYSLHSELKKVRELLGNRLDDKPDSEALVLLNQDSLIPVLYHLPDGFVNVTMGYPMRMSGVYAFLSAAGRVVEERSPRGYRTRDLLELIRSPYSEVGRDVEALLIDKGLPFVGEKELNQIPGLKKLVDWAVVPFEKAKNPKKFAKALVGVLSRLFKPEFFSREDAGIERFFVIKMLDTVVPILERGLFSNEDLSVSSLFRLFDTIMRDVSVPFEGEPLKGLQVMGLLETRLLSFDRVIVIDANDDILPGTEEVNPVAPEEVKRALGLPERYREEAITGYHFRRLIESSGEAYILWQSQFAPDKDGLETKKVKNRYVERIIWEKQMEKAKGGTDVLPDAGVEAVPIVIAPEALISSELLRKEEKHRDILLERFKDGLSPSYIDKYLLCPLRFYYEVVLGFEQKGEAEEVDASEVGSALHKALEEYFGKFAGSVLNKEDVKAEEILSLFKKHFSETKTASIVSEERRFLLEKTVSFRIKKFVENMPEELKILWVEKELIGSIELEDPNGKFEIKLKGIADRIDERVLRDVPYRMVIDYKTGYYKLPPKKIMELRKDAMDLSFEEIFRATGGKLQLIVYAFLNLFNEKEKHDENKLLVNLAFVDLRKSGKEVAFVEPDKKDSMSNLESFNLWLRDNFQLILERIVEHLFFSEYWLPAVDPSSCRFCPYRVACSWAR